MRLTLFCFTFFILLIFGFTPANGSDGNYHIPDQEVKIILEWQDLPGQQMSPDGKYLLLMHRPPMLNLEDIARPHADESRGS